MNREFKVGQKVRIKEHFWMIDGQGVGYAHAMGRYENKVAEIIEIRKTRDNYIIVGLSIDNGRWNWNNYWLEPMCEDSDEYED